MKRRTKIVATIGPACQDEATLEKLILAGMNVARLNFSHGSREDHRQVVERLRQLSWKLGQPVAILQDLQGPKIRIGKLPPPGTIMLVEGQLVTLLFNPISNPLSHYPGSQPSVILPVDFHELARFIQPGQRILLADGQMELQATDLFLTSDAGSQSPAAIQATVVQGGELKSHKGINLPGVNLDIPGFTEKDKLDLAFGLELGVDLAAMSFVRRAADIYQVKQTIAQLNPNQVDIPVIAKIERPESVKNLEEILDIADGVMVARGDLGVEMPPEDVPVAQKRIIEAANRHSRLVITATQMLESMIQNPRPTRAEASDVANAIFDGSDAVMLSGETAVGAFPIKAVMMMDAIIRKAEENLSRWGRWKGNAEPFTLPPSPASDYPSFLDEDAVHIARAASELAHDRNVAAIATFSVSGRTTLLISKTRPAVPILGFTSNEQTYTRMALQWGVTPQLVPYAENLEELLKYVETAIRGFPATRLSPAPGAPSSPLQVVLTCGFPVNQKGASNLLLLHRVRG